MKSVPLLPLLLTGLLLGGCAGPPASPARPNLTALAQGMTPEQVRAMWGEPSGIRPFSTDAPDDVIWVYRRLIKASDAPVATTVEEVPYYDPLTGVYTPIMDPHYTLATTELTQTIELVFIDGRLAAWKRHLSEEKNFR